MGAKLPIVGNVTECQPVPLCIYKLLVWLNFSKVPLTDKGSLLGPLSGFTSPKRRQWHFAYSGSFGAERNHWKCTRVGTRRGQQDALIQRVKRCAASALA